MIHQYPSAFISSTFLDLKSERKIVTELFRRLNIIPQALDTKPASNNSSKSEIIKGIRDSDFVVLVVGGRYGTIDRSFTESDAISITHWEYNLALRQKKPIIAMIKNSPSESDNNHEKAVKLEHFKNNLTRQHSPQYFDDNEELFEKVLHSIIPSYRDTLSKIRSAMSLIESENQSLKQEIESLKAKMNYSPASQSTLGGFQANHTNTVKLGDMLGGSYESRGLSLLDRAMRDYQKDK